MPRCRPYLLVGHSLYQQFTRLEVDFDIWSLLSKEKEALARGVDLTDMLKKKLLCSNDER